MNGMSSDRDFLDGQERAARTLRAAAGAAIMLGVSLDDLTRIVKDGIRDASGMQITVASQARAARLGARPSGEPLPVPAPRLTLVGEKDRPGSDGFYVPNLFPADEDRGQRAA